MSYMGIGEWLMLFICMLLVLPWLLGGLLVLMDLKEKFDRREQ